MQVLKNGLNSLEGGLQDGTEFDLVVIGAGGAAEGTTHHPEQSGDPEAAAKGCRRFKHPCLHGDWLLRWLTRRGRTHWLASSRPLPAPVDRQTVMRRRGTGPDTPPATVVREPASARRWPAPLPAEQAESAGHRSGSGCGPVWPVAGSERSPAQSCKRNQGITFDRSGFHLLRLGYL